MVVHGAAFAVWPSKLHYGVRPVQHNNFDKFPAKIESLVMVKRVFVTP